MIVINDSQVLDSTLPHDQMPGPSGGDGTEALSSSEHAGAAAGHQEGEDMRLCCLLRASRSPTRAHESSGKYNCVPQGCKHIGARGQKRAIIVLYFCPWNGLLALERLPCRRMLPSMPILNELLRSTHEARAKSVVSSGKCSVVFGGLFLYCSVPNIRHASHASRWTCPPLVDARTYHSKPALSSLDRCSTGALSKCPICMHLSGHTLGH